MKSVLIVDDQAEMIEVLQALIEDAELFSPVYTASSALEALNLIKDKKIDVIISDHKMPKHTGEWLAREVSLLEDSQNISFHIMTGYPNLVKTNFIKYGIKSLLRKPLSEEDLKKVS